MKITEKNGLHSWPVMRVSTEGWNYKERSFRLPQTHRSRFLSLL